MVNLFWVEQRNSFLFKQFLYFSAAFDFHFKAVCILSVAAFNFTVCALHRVWRYFGRTLLLRRRFIISFSSGRRFSIWLLFTVSAFSYKFSCGSGADGFQIPKQRQASTLAVMQNDSSQYSKSDNFC